MDDFVGDTVAEGEVEEGDLAFVVGLVVVEAVSDDPASGDELEVVLLDDFVGSGGHSVVAFVVVAGGKVEMVDFDVEWRRHWERLRAIS